MKNNDNHSFWDHAPEIEKKKPSLIKRILTISLYIIGFLVICFVLIGIFPPPTQPTDKTINNQVVAPSCKYADNNTKNILALINEYRNNQGLPAFKEYAALDKHQEAMLAELQKNGEVKNNELNNITTWQEKYVVEGSILYLENNWKIISASSFPTPCNTFDYWKANNKTELLSVNYNSLGIALSEKYAIIILGKKTEKPAQVATVEQNYIKSLSELQNSVRQQFNEQKAVSDAQKAISDTQFNDQKAIFDTQLQKSKDKTESDKRYKEFLSQITIAIAAENLKSGDRPSSATCSKAGSMKFSYISDKFSSASTDFGSIYVSVIGGTISSASGYYCSYIGNSISSCSGPNGPVYFSHIGDEISSTRNSTTNITTNFSYIGNSIYSADEADLGLCSIK